MVRVNIPCPVPPLYSGVARGKDDTSRMSAASVAVSANSGSWNYIEFQEICKCNPGNITIRAAYTGIHFKKLGLFTLNQENMLFGINHIIIFTK